ncbi:DHA2 family efflux MFS transporter permease subunit [Streptomyces litchfieldiae]|uniref:DHA2 family efflux MFS transporter permease subunit n=1 Tax=Streptomyces litchfieldiae TaxID=3075543 RepID=A0ABU2N4F6_9ACTN|nr:DHA2 family efflux MFS transporter permease subunit [Streptomyces sp. DSM 44938]MDT0347619.1 DHA2 family efflux MFS transporter permease subunit [Streptomyces sp. DSM 44938]
MTHAQATDRLDPALLRLIGVVLLGGIMGLLDGTMVAVGLDTLGGEFDASLSTIGWVATGYLLAVTVAIPLAAWAVERFGARRMWLLGLGVFLLGSLASGLAWDAGSLIAFRVVQGFGAGLVDPIMLTLLARAAGPARAGRVMGLMGVVLSLGPVLGPIVGGVLIEHLDWRWMFFINLPIGALAFALSLRLVPHDPPPAENAPRPDLAGLALLAPAFALMVLALSQAAERAEFATWQVLGPLAAGAALLTGYVRRALRPGDAPPPIDLRLFTSRGFTASVTVMALVGIGTFSSLFVLPLHYQTAHGHGVLEAGLLLAPFGLGSAAAMPLAGRLSDRIGARGLAGAGALLAALGALALTRVGPDSHELWPVLGSLVIGIGLGTIGAPTMGSLYRTLPASSVPQGSSALYMLNQLGASFAVAVVALIMETADDPTAGFRGVYWWVVCALLIVLAATRLLPGRPLSPEPDPAHPATRGAAS